MAELPAGVTANAFGPRLEAHIATLAGVFRLSRRQVRRVVVEELLGVPICLGAVDAAIMWMSAALADPWVALVKAVREAEAVHADETDSASKSPGWGSGFVQGSLAISIEDFTLAVGRAVTLGILRTRFCTLFAWQRPFRCASCVPTSAVCSMT